MSLKTIFLLLLLLLLMFLLTYLYLNLSEFCVQVELWCPSPHHTFKTEACCSSLWLSLGAPLGLGNECHFKMADLEEGCPMYDCYKNYTTGEWNTNGCSYVPNQMLTQGSCDIHDLCYITPHATKADCDSKFLENIELVYCNNVNLMERISCSAKANVAVAVVAGINQFYDDCHEMRDSCVPTRSGSDWIKTILPIFIIFFSTLIFVRSRWRKTTEDHCQPKDTTEYHHQPKDTTQDHCQAKYTAGDHHQPEDTTEDLHQPKDTTGDHHQPKDTTEDYQ